MILFGQKYSYCSSLASVAILNLTRLSLTFWLLTPEEEKREWPLHELMRQSISECDSVLLLSDSDSVPELAAACSARSSHSFTLSSKSNLALIMQDLVTLLQSGKISFSPTITFLCKSLAFVLNMGRIPLLTKQAISPSTARYSFFRPFSKSGEPSPYYTYTRGLAIATN